MLFENKKRYIAVFVIKEQEVRVVLRKRRFKASNSTVRYKKRTFPIDVSHPTYAKGLKLFYFIDIKDGQVLLNEVTEESVINPEILDIILARKIVSQLTSNLANTETKMKVLSVLLGIIIGALGGFIAGGYF